MSAPLQVAPDAPAAPSFPVQTTNVMLHVHETLPEERAAVLARQEALRAELVALEAYQHVLGAVARAAGIELP